MVTQSRRTRWVRSLLWALWTFIIIVASVAFTCVFVVFVLPPALLLARRARRRLLKRFQDDGRLITLDSLRSRLRTGQATLLIMDKEGWLEGWLYPERPEQLVPDGTLVTLRDFLSDNRPSEPTQEAAEALHERLSAYDSVVMLAPLEGAALERLPDEFPEQVLAWPRIWGLFDREELPEEDGLENE
jgi:hypothetical protein